MFARLHIDERVVAQMVSAEVSDRMAILEEELHQLRRIEKSWIVPPHIVGRTDPDFLEALAVLKNRRAINSGDNWNSDGKRGERAESAKTKKCIARAEAIKAMTKLKRAHKLYAEAEALMFIAAEDAKLKALEKKDKQVRLCVYVDSRLKRNFVGFSCAQSG